MKRRVAAGLLALGLLPACGGGGSGGGGGLPTLDASFDGDGVLILDIDGGQDRLSALAVQPDGKIVGVGRGSIAGMADWLVLRVLPNGVPDPAFGGGDGIVTTPVGLLDSAQGVAIQPDGKIVVAGIAGITALNFAWAVARYHADGSLDASFDGDGLRVLDLHSDDDSAWAVAVQPDGRILVAGYTSLNGSRDFAVTRLNADGSSDGGFGTAGLAVTDVGGTDFASAMALQPDGKVVVAGHSNGDFVLVRYAANGVLDPSFDGDGIVVTSLGGAGDAAFAVALQADGGIVAGGNAAVTVVPDFGLVRCLPDGSLDPAFSGDGKATFDATGNAEQGWALAVRADGRILQAGMAFVGGSDALVIVRYLADGAIDLSFDEDGIAVVNPAPTIDQSRAALFQPDGKALVAGNVGDDLVIVRFNP